MRSRNVRLENAYLSGVQGFCRYVKNHGISSEGDFCKAILTEFDKVDVSGLPIEETLFYILGFFDRHQIEIDRADAGQKNSFELADEEWVKGIMDRLGLESIDKLAVEMVGILMNRIDSVYVKGDELREYLLGRIVERDSKIGKEYILIQQKKEG